MQQDNFESDGIELVYDAYAEQECYGCGGRADGRAKEYQNLHYCRSCAAQMSAQLLERHISIYNKQLHIRNNQVRCPNCACKFMADEHLAHKQR